MRPVVALFPFLSMMTFLVEDSTAIPVSSYSNHHYDQYREDAQLELVKRQFLWMRFLSGLAVPFLLILASSTTSWMTRKYCIMSALCLSVLQFYYAMF